MSFYNYECQISRRKLDKGFCNMSILDEIEGDIITDNNETNNQHSKTKLVKDPCRNEPREQKIKNCYVGVTAKAKRHKRHLIIRNGGLHNETINDYVNANSSFEQQRTPLLMPTQADLSRKQESSAPKSRFRLPFLHHFKKFLAFKGFKEH